MSAQASTGTGRLNGVPVTPESARLLVHAVMFATSHLTKEDPHRPRIAANLAAAFDDVEPFGPWNDLFAELKRIAGVGAGT